ncbi:tyrosinase family oxidase copper chaperone [Streptomyces hypolithicus]
MGLIRRRNTATGHLLDGFLTRRVALRAAFTAGVIAGTAAALAPILGKRPDTAPATPGREPARGAATERFAETYRGRHIQGAANGRMPVAARHRHRRYGGAMSVATAVNAEVRIDGRPLHVMRRADGTYLSLVNHYESFPTLLAVARAAVDELGDAQLSASPSHSL